MSCRRPRAASLAALVAVVALVLGGCDTNDGRELIAPSPGATAPAIVPATTVPPAAAVNPPVGSSDTGPLVLASTAFAEGQPIPDRYACTGTNVAPPLAWSGVPTGTIELALTVVDVTTADHFVHWVATNIPPSVIGIDEGALPESAIEARNDSSEFGWFGPCPPPGETHTYLFTLFALSGASGVADGTGGPEAVEQIAVVPGFAATLSGTFTGSPDEP